MYLDLIFKIANYIEKHYPEPSMTMGKQKFYKRSAECFALNNILASKESVQTENKYLYLTFINALTDVREHFS